MSRPWMPLYVADYLADTRRLSTLEHGAYMLLIMDYWRNGGLPDADEDLANITGMVLKDWLRIKPKIAALFSPGWTHKRIEEEIAKAETKNERRSQAGANGAAARWGAATVAGSRSERLALARQQGKHTEAEWKAMVAVFGGCVKCNAPLSSLHGEACTKDHIVPISKGGSDSIENIQPLCRECNAGRSVDPTDYRELQIPDWRNRMSERLANASGTHAGRVASSSQPQSHSSNEECTLAPAAAYADEIRKTYLRSSRAEPSLYLAGKWRQAGWPIEIVCDVIHAKLEATPGKNFPLQYFENAIAEAVERSKAPVPVTARTGGRSFAPSNSMPEPIIAKPMSVETQRNAMRTFVRTKNWPFLSPPPGEPGCPVSPEIIAEFQPAKESAA